MSPEQGPLDQARRLVAGLELYSGTKSESVRVTRLGGLTNLVFLVDEGWRQTVLRIPGLGTQEYINRGHEEHAAREAARVQVSPEVLHFDAATGVMVTRLVDSALTMTPEHFRTRPGAPARAGQVLRQLHTSDAVFEFRFELFRIIDEYLRLLAGKDSRLPAGYHELMADTAGLRSALQAHALPSVACHCDPLCENFLDVGARMWMVDWEYSGMNDPLWDLADLSVEGGFSAAQDEEMMAAYFGGEPRPAERGRIVIYKAMCDVVWTLWGLIQHANRNPVEDFWAYSLQRFERCKQLMASREFPRYVGHVRQG